MERKYKKQYWYLILSISVVILIFPLIINKIDNAILHNSQLMGEEIARSFAQNEVFYTNQYKTILDTMEYQLRPKNRTEDIKKIFQNYLDFVYDTMDLKEVELYAVIDGKMQAATYWEGDSNFNPFQTDWYQDAIKANGTIVYSDSYIDARLNKPVVTLSKQIQGTNDVVAIDIYPNNALQSNNAKTLPTGSNYFLCDSKGSLLGYHTVGSPVAFQEVQEYFDFIFQEIQAGKHDSFDSSTNGLDGEKRGVYYYQLSSGWYSIITIPYKELLKSSDDLRTLFLVILSLFFLMLILFIVIDYYTNKKVKLYNEIVRVLGNSYYGLYLIDLEHNQYSMLKAPDQIRSQIPPKENYNVLLEVLTNIIHKDDYQEFLDTFSQENMKNLVKKRVKNFGGDFKRLFNGEYRWAHIQMLYDESLQKNSVVLCFKDINESKQQELLRLELLKASLDSVDQMAKSKNVFFSQMSHDMRTPLNGIIGLSELIKKHLNDHEKALSSLDKIISLSNQLLNLINDILEISKIEEGKLELKTEHFSIKNNLEELVSIFQLQTENNQKQFLVHLDIKDIYIIGDWGKIQQIIDNLLSNAFKFTKDDGRIEFSVTETYATNSKYIKYYFTIKDDGVGMSQEFLKKIFIPFERETQFGASKVSGTGLGMPIVYELVHKMDGTINITSELGKGSIFEIMIPCRISSKNKKTEINSSSSSLFNDDTNSILVGKRVLLAEDNEINMEIATEVLKMYQLEVVQAWNGKEAVELFSKSEEGYFDFILMDMQMPVMDGCKAAESIRKLPREDVKTIPIIAVTANAFAEDIALTKKAGMNTHISKPIDFSVLKETMIQLFISKHSM